MEHLKEFSCHFYELLVNGNFTIIHIEEFLENGGNINAIVNSLPVFWYIFTDINIPTLFCKHLLEKYKIDLDIVVKGETLLTVCIRDDFVLDDIAILLIRSGANINYINSDGYTPLELACMVQSYGIISALLDVNVDLNRRRNNDDGYLADLMLRFNGQDFSFTIFNRIITKADIEILNTRFHNGTILEFLANVEIVEDTQEANKSIKILMDRGININDKYFFHEICYHGNNEIFDIIVNSVSEDILNPQEGYFSPLQSAISGGNVDIVDALLARGVNINFVGGFGKSILMSLLDNIRSFDIVVVSDILDRLLTYDLNINYVNERGRTALFNANNKDILAKLVLYGADINHRDNKNHSVLYCAIEHFRDDIVDTMLSFCPSLDGVDELLMELTPSSFISTLRSLDDSLNLPSYRYDSSLTSYEKIHRATISLNAIKQSLNTYYRK